MTAYFIAGFLASGLARITSKVGWFYLKPRLRRKPETAEEIGWWKGA